VDVDVALNDRGVGAMVDAPVAEDRKNNGKINISFVLWLP